MPVDPQPRNDGNLAIYRDVHGQLRARVVTAAEPIQPYERPGMPHFATCTPANEPIGRTAGGAVSLADARRRKSNAGRRRP
jgi:hypothetical protein